MIDFWLFIVVLMHNKGGNMTKESKHRREDKKKPQMTLKERRAKKHEKKYHKLDHQIDQSLIE
jgi:uncharacterized membrane protein